MIVGIAVETTVDSNDASAVTSTRATTTARRRRGSKRGVDRVVESRAVAMEAESIECSHARPRRDERIQLQGMEGKLLSGGPSRVRHARLLRGAAPRRRDQQHLLPDAEASAPR